MSSDKPDMFENRLENLFVKSLRHHGFIFPESEEELDTFRDNLSEQSYSMPAEFADPLQILKRGKIELSNLTESSEDFETERNLARAAREGKEIPDEIKRKMKEDKRKAQGDDEAE